MRVRNSVAVAAVGVLAAGIVSIPTAPAHAADTITAADQIVVLSETGRVAQIGTHGQLYAQENGQYRAFWDARTRAAGWTLV